MKKTIIAIMVFAIIFVFAPTFGRDQISVNEKDKNRDNKIDTTELYIAHSRIAVFSGVDVAVPMFTTTHHGREVVLHLAYHDEVGKIAAFLVSEDLERTKKEDIPQWVIKVTLLVIEDLINGKIIDKEITNLLKELEEMPENLPQDDTRDILMRKKGRIVKI